MSMYTLNKVYLVSLSDPLSVTAQEGNLICGSQWKLFQHNATRGRLISDTRPQTKDSTWCWATNLQSFFSCMWSSCKKKMKTNLPLLSDQQRHFDVWLGDSERKYASPSSKCPFHGSWAKANFSHKSYTEQAMPSPKPWWNSFRHSTHANMWSPENSPFLKIVLGRAHCFPPNWPTGGAGL